MKLGDSVEKAIEVVTLGQGKKIATYMAKLQGKEDCGCGRRKSTLNKVKLPKVNLDELSNFNPVLKNKNKK